MMLRLVEIFIFMGMLLILKVIETIAGSYNFSFNSFSLNKNLYLLVPD
jgi:hypothetical protein